MITKMLATMRLRPIQGQIQSGQKSLMHMCMHEKKAANNAKYRDMGATG